MGQYRILQILWSAFIFAIFVWMIYKGFFRTPKNYKGYVNRAVNFEIFLRNKKKALKVLQEALSDASLSKIERASVLVRLGLYYFNEKDYTQASKYLDDALEIALKENFPYNKTCLKIITAYMQMEQQQKAINLYYNLLERQRYDSKFKEVKILQKTLGLKEAM